MMPPEFDLEGQSSQDLSSKREKRWKAEEGLQGKQILKLVCQIRIRNREELGNREPVGLAGLSSSLLETGIIRSSSQEG